MTQTPDESYKQWLAHDDFIPGPKTGPKDGELWWVSPLDESLADIGKFSAGKWLLVGELLPLPCTPIAPVTTLAQDAANRKLIGKLVEALKDAAPDLPMNQDEQGGCVWCGGASQGSTESTENPEDHETDCGWIKARTALKRASAAGYGGK